MRGRVVGPLSPAQIVARARYLAGLPDATIDTLDEHVRKDGALAMCPTIYYRLRNYNGGKDPTAPDPATRWSKVGSTLVNVTSDCIGGAAWCGGFDRYQPERFAHIYDGWVNTDSMRMDARGPMKCFIRLARPEPGCFVVFASGAGSHAVGHIGTVIGAPAEWDEDERDCWKRLEVVDIAARSGRANKLTTGLAWFDQDAWFIRSTMKP